jgi:tRNA U34 2-thiouridine synthase MnmA/TrmU
VIGKDIKKNRLIVGFGKETEKKEFLVEKVNWIEPNFQFSIFNFQLFVRIRHQGELLKCKLKIKNSKLKIILTEPYRGIAPGQAAVFYKKVTNCGLRITGLEVVGGGIITI